MSVAENEFTALHEGKRPKGAVLERIVPFVGPKRILGRVTEIQYTKDVTDGDFSYKHPFAEHAQPTLFVDATGRMGFYRGRYVVTYRGIEDRKRSEVEDERLPGRASRLITLGRVEFVKYKWEDDDGDEHEDEIVFSSRTAPTISHDQAGDLHVTGGRLLKEHTMAKKAFGRGKARRNPSSGKSMGLGERSKRTLMTAAVGGIGALTTLIVMDKFVNRMTWAPERKGAFKIAAGIGLAIVAGYAIPSVPGIAAGLAIGGVVAGGRDLYGKYLMPRIEGSTNRSCPALPTAPVTAAQAAEYNRANPNCPQAVATPAAAFPFLPAGRVPAGYQQTSGAACGV